jgi:RNA polymerase sigma factor (TIGR02999 family)
MSDVTVILNAIEEGDPRAAEQLLPAVYAELRRLAAARMAREAGGQTLQPTALVHEAYLRLVGDPERKWDGRAHFFGAAAEAMRRILIDRARRKHAVRHGGGALRVELGEFEIAATTTPDELLEVDEALGRFAAHDEKKAELVKLRYFAGLTIEEAAETMGISAATAKRWWTYSRAWLYQELAKEKVGRAKG